MKTFLAWLALSLTCGVASTCWRLARAERYFDDKSMQRYFQKVSNVA
jgi:hypothetical protein